MRLNRRHFLRISGQGILGACGAGTFAEVTGQTLSGRDIRIALIGCGSRGIGAAKEALEVSQGAKVVAAADLRNARLDNARRAFPTIPRESAFESFDAFKEAISVTSVNYVIIATPPAFHPEHMHYAISQGRNVFMEKPAAVDVPGARTVLAASELARNKNLSIVCGLVRRHDTRHVQCMERCRSGDFGRVESVTSVFRNTEVSAPTWDTGKKRLDNQLSNWRRFVALGGDFVVYRGSSTFSVGRARGRWTG